MPTTTEDVTKDFMGNLIAKVYGELTKNNPESLGPNNFIAFDPIGKVLMDNSFDFAINGIFGTPPAPKMVVDTKGAHHAGYFNHRVQVQDSAKSTKHGSGHQKIRQRQRITIKTGQQKSFWFLLIF
ncbi:hypothetical protein [Kaistella palustris]|uniref:hypothetical protein n=1 Tax=Kaistella palustris TaxID=493376 RepID=UPI00041E8F5D|nr:hypothetical protein [Kaistella palustris]